MAGYEQGLIVTKRKQMLNEYRIEHRIKTLAQLYEPFTYHGYEFIQWENSFTEGPRGDAWRVTKVIKADDITKAFKIFYDELDPIINRIAFVSQCFTSMDVQPFMILKLNNNDEKIFYARYSSEKDAVPLVFDSTEMNALAELEKYHEKGDVFRLLREATNASFFYTRLTMLIAALEAMAGEIEGKKPGIRITNKPYIKKILKNKDLYENIFGYRAGLRNQILHGHKPDFDNTAHAGKDYIGEIYSAILRYFKETHNVEIATNVVNPQRNPTENYKVWAGWLRPKNPEQPLSLKGVLSDLAEEIEKYGSPKEIEFCNTAPSNY